MPDGRRASGLDRGNGIKLRANPLCDSQATDIFNEPAPGQQPEAVCTQTLPKKWAKIRFCGGFEQSPLK
jgi:hypothetical protein